MLSKENQFHQGTGRFGIADLWRLRGKWHPALSRLQLNTCKTRDFQHAQAQRYAQAASRGRPEPRALSEREVPRVSAIIHE